MNSKEDLKSLFQNVVTGFLELKGNSSDAEEMLDALFEYNTKEKTKEFYADYINLLFYKDIVYGVWNQKSTVEQAVFQLIYAIDLELFLQSLMVSPSAKKLIQEIDSIKDADDLSAFLYSLNDDMTWIPVLKEYRHIYVFLLINMITLVYFDCSFQDTSDIQEIIETVG